MSEEMTATAVQDSGVASEGVAGDSGNYLADAFENYFSDPAEREEADTPKDETNDNVAQKAQAPKDETVKEEPKPEGETVEEEKPDPFKTAFGGENGAIDFEKVMGFKFDDIGLRSDTVQQQVQPQQSTPEDSRPQWQKELEEEQTFRSNIESSTLGLLDKVYQAITDGTDPIQALKTVYEETKAGNEKWFREREMERSFKEKEELKERIRAEEREARLPEIAKSNALSIANNLPGESSQAKIELYNRIMFGQDAGGELLEDMFIARHPDYAKYDQKKLDQEKMRFVNELQSDPKRLQRHFQRAFRNLAATPESLKSYAETVARNKEAQVRGNAAAAQKAPSPVHRPAAQKSTSGWDNYFSSAPKTRIN